ncbi:MAG: hypothetical protein EA342_02000, partial [Leptolyngbya sp. LCM1.Bin17]
MPSPAYRYNVGGSLAKDAPTYVYRQADAEFYQALKQGEFCYVLNSRQMGKSSLRVRTTQRLQAEGIACGIIDITAIGSHDITPEQWYLGVMRRLARSLGLKVKVMPWWNEHSGLSPVQRLGEFLEDVVLAELAQPIVIFIDEIDSILRLEFKDDFFALIRACYNQRADHDAYHRLTFALLGVATPSDLIQDKKRTPFNIGQAIELYGFQPGEVEPLAEGLRDKADHPQAVLQAILDWTGGQPLLTQKLCQLIAESPQYLAAGHEAELVEEQVRTQIITNWEAQDEPEHLRTIRDRLFRDDTTVARLLGLYQQILHQGRIAADGSREQIELRLSGLVVERQGQLQSFNPIYRAVFSPDWVAQQLAELRPYAAAISAWLASGGEDESRLLRGPALEDAQAWARGKSLGDNDYQFLTASEKLDKQAIQEANRILAAAQREAEQELQEARETNRKARRLLAGAIAVAAIVATATGGAAIFATREAQEARADATESQRDAEYQQRTASFAELKANFNVGVASIRAGIADRQSVAAIEREQEAQQQVDEATAQLAEIDRQAQQEQQAAREAVERATAQLAQAQAARSEAETAVDQAKVETATALAERARASYEATLVRRVTNLERAGVAASQRFQFQETEGLLVAYRATDEAVQVMNEASQGLIVPEIDYLAASPLLALQTHLNEIRETRLKGHQGGVKQVVLSPNGTRILTSGEDNTARLWDLSGNQLAVIKNTGSEISQILFSPNSEQVVTSSEDGTVRVWDLEGNQVAKIKTNKGEALQALFSPDGNQILMHGESNTIQLWDLAEDLSRKIEVAKDGVEQALFSFDNKKIVTRGRDGLIKVWDREGNELTSIEVETEGANQISLSPNGTILAIRLSDGTAVLWDLVSNDFPTIDGHEGGINQLLFSSDGTRIVTGGNDSMVRLWDKKGNLLSTMKGHQAAVWGVAFSPDDTKIATSGGDGTVRLWDLQGEQITTIENARQGGSYLEFNPDGTRIVTLGHMKIFGGDGKVRLWDLQGNQVDSFEIYDDGVRQVTFNADGSKLVGLSPPPTFRGNGVVRIWSLYDNALATLEGHEGYLHDISFNSDSNLIVTGGGADD